MLRYIYILASAALLLAACTKTDVTYDAPSEIAFAPAAAVMTKDGETAYVGGQLNVFAYTGSTPYFANVTFLDTDTGEDGEPVNDGEYVGTPTQYWPNTKSLRFAGYTGDKYDDDDNDKIATYNGTSLTISGYQQNGNKDLMWFFTEEIEAKGDVEPTLYHACAKITIKVTGENACLNWPIKEISMNSVSMSGDVTFTDGSVSWDNLAAAAPLEMFKGNAAISTDPTAEAIVIPQEPMTLKVVYKDTDNEKDDISLQYNGTDKWEAGKHYTYTLNFLNPYKIDFSVDTVTPWDGTTPEITI